MTPLSFVSADFLTSGGASLVVRTLLGGPAGALGVTVLGLGAGLVGSSIISRLLADEDDGDDGDAMGDADDDPFGGGGGDDPFGGDFDDDGGDDGFGMGDFDDDPFGEGDADDDTAEVREQVDELEDELASLSSTVNTVRSENKEISEQVEEIGDDVRGLLDIYEMVTRGINPFVDETENLGGGGFEDGSLGLFDGDDGDDAESDLDEDIAGADAESFFDDDAFDDDSFADEEEDFDMMDDNDVGGDPSADGGGKSFDELKAEYESGDADWAGEASDDDGPTEDASEVEDDDAGFEADDAFEEAGDPLSGSSDEAPLEDAFEDVEESFDDPAAANGHGDWSEDPEEGEKDPLGGSQNDPDERSSPPDRGRSDGVADPRDRTVRGRESDFEFVGDDVSDSGAATKPYLTSLPEGYVGDLLVIEWLESLVEASDPTDAARAVGYYERVEWISADVAERLRDFLTGFGPIDANVVDDPGTETLTLDHHVQSLRYIRQLNGASAESLVVGRWDRISDGPGGGDGVGRRSLFERSPAEVDRGR